MKNIDNELREILDAYKEEIKSLHHKVQYDKISLTPDAILGLEDNLQTKYIQSTKRIIAEAERQAHDRFSTWGLGLHDKPEVIQHDVPCGDCGSKEWHDWAMHPHNVFNWYCREDRSAYLCLPCFSKRVLTQTQKGDE